MWHSTSSTLAHSLLEAVAYFVGARIYWHTSRNVPKPQLNDRLTLIGATIFGAFIGSKLLHIAEHLPYLLSHKDASLWIGGKSVLGGFMGGTLGSELAKKSIGWKIPTGDPWVPALAIGLIIGRTGCQLSGVWDQTYGTPTTVPWAWDYGDGIGRHPTALYEMLLITMAYIVSTTKFLLSFQGASFATFLLSYCAIRFGLEFFKPPFGDTAAGSLPVASYAGLSAIQWAALLGIAWYGLLLWKRLIPYIRRSHG